MYKLSTFFIVVSWGSWYRQIGGQFTGLYRCTRENSCS
jgi:hypothetical protein